MPIEPEPFEEGLPHRFFTLKQVAAMLATSEAQVYALVRAGDLPAIKIGGRGQWRVENRELDQWIQAQYRRTRFLDEDASDPDDLGDHDAKPYPRSRVE
ncbi:helix-turn-helix transcriptional regulator [Intrasporangium sp.]|uniref:helix-turn-helix transcriptional regulator n=1 Tax=Intrasporangium sp. TaxID=1925024 RepID=UPI003463F695